MAALVALGGSYGGCGAYRGHLRRRIIAKSVQDATIWHPREERPSHRMAVSDRAAMKLPSPVAYQRGWRGVLRGSRGFASLTVMARPASSLP